jgi:penicillin-binding protein-related factor A (putative recombinase)
MNKDGKLFEQQWKKSATDDMYYFRLKDSPSSFGQDSTFVRFTLNNPYDAFIFYNRFLFPMELKSTELTSISIQRDKGEKGKMIKHHQIEGLTEANKYEGIFSGFVFDFRNTGNTYWFGIENFTQFLSETTKKSINEKDVIEYGGILVDKTKKKVKYTYNIKELLNRIVVVKNG